MKHPLILSVVLFLALNAVTNHVDPTEVDELNLAHMKRRISLVQPVHLERNLEQPLENCQSCLFEDPFAGMTGSGCRWSSTLPLYSCRIGGFPVTLWQSSRLGGAQEVLPTALGRLTSPLTAVQYLKMVEKLCILFLFSWALKIFSLPAALLPFIALSPQFHSLGYFSTFDVLTGILVYLNLCLSFSHRRWAFPAATACMVLSIYFYVSTAVWFAPAILALYFAKRDPRRLRRRAYILFGVAAACVLTRIVINLSYPPLKGDLISNIVGDQIFAKSGSDILQYLRDFYHVFSLSNVLIVSGDWLGITGSMWEPSFPSWFLGAGLIGMFLASLILAKGKEGRRLRGLVGAFVLVTFGSFLISHNDTPSYIFRVRLLVPIALVALYLGVEFCGQKLARGKWRRYSHVPMAWLWATAILASITWVVHFREVGPVMTHNAAFATRLSERLLELRVTRPIFLRESHGQGTLDWLSKEKIRPLYLGEDPPNPVRSRDDLAKHALLYWTKLGAGTLIQKNVDLHWGGLFLSRSEIESFAREHSIQITRMEFFPYRKDWGYWIIDFKSTRWQPSARGGGGSAG